MTTLRSQCPRCGADVRPGTKFCVVCGLAVASVADSLAAARAAPPKAAPPIAAQVAPRAGAAPAAGAQATAVAAGKWRGLSSKWIIIPTLLYAVIAQRLVPTLIIMAIGAVLAFLQRRPEVPARARPFLPALQPVVVFLFLGGHPVMLAAVVFIFATVFAKASRIVPALGPWWAVQSRIPSLARRVLSFVIPFGIGLYFGQQQGGNVWTVTLLSMAVGTLCAFLLTFTPPAQLLARAPAGSV